MITLIHGEDITASRNYYFELKQQIREQKTIDGVGLTPIELREAVSVQDLFGQSPTLCIENLFSKRKSSKEIEELAEIINGSPSDVVLWEAKELTPKQVGLFSKATIKLFKIPATIFALLDGLKPNNGKQLIQLFHTTLESKDAEFVLVMLQRQVRILLALQDPSKEQISEVSRMALWQKGKLDKQTKLFSKEELLELHAKLFQLELDVKTGNLVQPLGQEIDLLLLSL